MVTGNNKNQHRPEELRTTLKVIDPRPRINQPKGYEDSRYSVSLVRGRKHDYIFLPQGYTDEETGKEYKAGYYDENGDFYERVIIEAGKNRETLACCDFCGTQIKLKWEAGALVSCPNCGAALHEVPDRTIYDHQLRPVPSHPVFKERPSRGYYSSDDGSPYGTLKMSFAIAGLLLIVILVIVVIASMRSTNKKSTPAQVVYVNSTPAPTPMPDARSYFAHSPILGEHRSPIFIKEANASFKWNDKDKCYYSEDGKYGLRYNEGSYTIQGQFEYWYEEIAYNYKDGMGWMRYNYANDEWSIEIERNNWRKLPEDYERFEKWHINKPGDGKYYGASTVCITDTGDGYGYKIGIDTGGRECVYLAEENNYFDPVTGCHFYYNDILGEATWTYYFDGIGWCTYDEANKKWYTLTVTSFGVYWHYIEESIVKHYKGWHVVPRVY